MRWEEVNAREDSNFIESFHKYLQCTPYVSGTVAGPVIQQVIEQNKSLTACALVGDTHNIQMSQSM